MKALWTRLYSLSLLTKVSILCFSVMTCIIIIKFKPFKYLKSCLLGRHRIQRLLRTRPKGDADGEMALEVYKEIKQSNKVNISNQDLEVEAEILQKTDSNLESASPRSTSGKPQEENKISCYSRILNAKHIIYESEKMSLKRCLIVISKVLNLKNELYNIRKQPIKKDDKELCRNLKDIWEHFLPSKAFERYTNDWQLIGFQGSDPYTDLRAAGPLFIDNFLYFIRSYSNKSKKLLELASDERSFFFFAVTGIHATMWGIELLEEQHIIDFFIRDCFQYEPYTVYQELFCRMLIRFTEKWSHEKPDLMEFNTVTAVFLKSIKEDKTDIKEAVHASLLSRKKNQ